ncbi:uncharacterized protein NEPG_01058 [Nematocida parisii ERTm1]|uniref:uncharacterized protein n=1 Tax=Nematocida parisii (strain ERTm1 / ATCC PRA-289) TaxID=881290 RepID=UPI000264B1C4|nr:uncharacterized protein NEPG_01058 [Nematocida parisii ERTm1]EIJ94390.1 hypothetical protein NEPG_01058 [Nematocida parisii ERTm1]KAI5145195.1 hypothetical protein NEPAR07_1521 [Nematocida parisii]|eukprot:XP_013058886.1 hypothetical protein NEPG_01058 [Nematocida parisii ERTm1]
MFKDILEYLKSPNEENNGNNGNTGENLKNQDNYEDGFDARISEYFNSRNIENKRKINENIENNPENNCNLKKLPEKENSVNSDEFFTGEIELSSDEDKNLKENKTKKLKNGPEHIKHCVINNDHSNESFLCTQSPIISVEAKLNIIKQRNPNQEYITLCVIRNSQKLKMAGIVLGYIIRHSASDKTGLYRVITDGVDEMVCAVCPSVLQKYKLEKDSIVLLKSPSVWRVPYSENICVLNIFMSNVISVIPEK